MSHRKDTMVLVSRTIGLTIFLDRRYRLRQEPYESTLKRKSVVDGSLKVYGIEYLRIAGGSIMTRVATGDTMSTCVIIGERAAVILRTELSWRCGRGRVVYELNTR